ncbi:MAG: VanZ family protein [Burkholderiaceae bacterium]
MRVSAAVWRRLFWICAAAGVVLSLWPHPEHSQPWFPNVDKVEHALSFATLVVVGRLGGYRSKWKLFCGLVLLGAAIEVMQSFTATRTAEWADLGADTLGILAGLAAARLAERRSGGLPEEDRG